jgi:Holliday junction resolvase RusA-like endonuclease
VTGRVHTFQVYGEPAPQGSKKALPNPRDPQRPFVVDDNKPQLKSWRAETVAAAQELWEGPPMDGPLRLEVRFTFARPASAKRWWRLKRTKPDIDKLCRAMMDALTSARVITDDARVADLRALKVLAAPDGSTPIGATVRITEINEEASPS